MAEQRNVADIIAELEEMERRAAQAATGVIPQAPAGFENEQLKNLDAFLTEIAGQRPGASANMPSAAAPGPPSRLSPGEIDILSGVMPQFVEPQKPQMFRETPNPAGAPELRGFFKEGYEPRMERPSGHEPKSAEDQNLVDERKQREDQRAKEKELRGDADWLEGNIESLKRLSEPYEKRFDIGNLMKERGKKQSLQHIIEGLGKIYPSVAADYLLTGGPPKAEPVIAEDTREEIGKIDEQIAGEQIRKVFKSAGIDLPENIPSSVLLSTAATLGRWGKENKAEDTRIQGIMLKERDRWFQSSEIKGIREAKFAAQRVLALLNSPNPTAHKDSIKQRILALGDKRISTFDVQDAEKRYGIWAGLEDRWAKWVNEDLSQKMIDQMRDSMTTLVGTYDKAINDKAVERAESLANIPGLNIPKETTIKYLLGDQERTGAGRDTSEWVSLKRVATGKFVPVPPEYVEEAINSGDFER